jgi:hypothetical protein
MNEFAANKSLCCTDQSPEQEHYCNHLSVGEAEMDESTSKVEKGASPDQYLVITWVIWIFPGFRQTYETCNRPQSVAFHDVNCVTHVNICIGIWIRYPGSYFADVQGLRPTGGFALAVGTLDHQYLLEREAHSE